MMYKKYLFFLIVLAIAGCGAPKTLVSHKDNAEKAELAGNYAEATMAWKDYFSQQASAGATGGELYARAAQTAVKAGNQDQAMEWFNQAISLDYADVEMYSTLADIYRSKNNVSKEMETLEYLDDNFGEEAEGVNNRLFSLYTNNNLDEKALQAWKKMSPDEQRTERNLAQYFRLNKELENDALSDSISLVLLEVNPDNVPALEWNATNKYTRAENRYKREMARYERDKSRTQYRILLKELDKVTADFRTALGYFEKLWELNPESRNVYAGYMTNIHLRFEDTEKADYYRKFLK